MAVLKCLDVSTAHVTPRDMELLGCDGRGGAIRPSGPVYSYPYAEGTFITGPDFTETDPTQRAIVDVEIVAHGFSDSFLKLIHYAREQGVSMIRLDADGDFHGEETGLDHIDWSNYPPDEPD
jgi:hypothetical protein